MSPRTFGDDCRNIVVADEDKVMAGLVVEALLHDGHAVFHAYDGLSATELALGLKVCDLVISNTRVGGVDGPDPRAPRALAHACDPLPCQYGAVHGRAGAAATH